MIYYERDALPEDHWQHPDIAAFYAQHAERYEAIREREWQREYEAAPPFTKACMALNRHYLKMLMEPVTGILARSEEAIKYFRGNQNLEP